MIGGRKKRILFVDDEQGFTTLVKINLEKTGKYEVRVENQGSQGLAAARECKPDLIFLDIVMPDAEGGQLAAQIAEDPALKDTPIVFLTAVVSKSEIEDHGGVIGGYPFLAKPVAPEQVIAMIEQRLGS